jgi:phospholipid/cholesterol/gamma-HCH transport system substrate-binding protein
MAGRTGDVRTGRGRGGHERGRLALGVGFLLILVLTGALTYAFFVKAFTPSVDITVEASHIGLQLSRHADVKMRGLLVGEVRDVESDGRGARIDVALKPETVDTIPANVRVRIVPKTLFGEKYVELVVPPDPAPLPVAAGDVIVRERASVEIELERVLDDTYPLLRTLQPAKLNATLSALATALEGRGDDIGGNLTRLNDYLGEFNPHLPALKEDVTALADVADVYDDASPDLVRLLANATKTGNTVVVKQRALEDFLTDLAGTSTSARYFLADNERSLIRVGEVSRPTLDLLETYSPEYSCLLEGMANWVPHFEDAFGKGDHFDGSSGALHITLEIVNQNNAYTDDDRPAFLDDRGPGCRGLPNPPYSQENLAPRSGVQTGVGNQPGPGSRVPVFDTTGGYAGTAAEQQIVDAIVGPVTGTAPEDVPDIATLLFGPMARGTEVSVK